MIARIESLSCCAPDRRLSTSIPQPSIMTVPSADASKVLQRPSGARPRSRLNSMNILGVGINVTPPATAAEHSPARKLKQARWTATNEDEHAVSTVMLGPFNPSKYEIRP